MKMYSACAAAVSSCALLPASSTVFLNILPTKTGTSSIPIFWIQYIIEKAVPRFFSGTIFGTDGHIAEGTRD